MKRELLSDAMSGICDEYIAEAGRYTASPEARRDGAVLRYLALACAAVFAVAILIPTAAHVIKLTSRSAQPGASVPGTESSAPATEAPKDPDQNGGSGGTEDIEITADILNRISESAADMILPGMPLSEVVDVLGQPGYIIGSGLYEIRYILEGDAGFFNIYSTRRVGDGYFVSNVELTRFNTDLGEPYALPDYDGSVDLTLADGDGEDDIISVDETKLRFIFYNSTPEDVELLPLAKLEKQTEDGWRSVPYGEETEPGETTVIGSNKVEYVTLNLRSLYGMLPPGRYRINAEAHGAGGAEYRASCEFYISYTDARLLGEMLEVDAGNFISASDAERVTVGMNWQDVAGLLGKPASIVRIDPLRVRYVCEGGESGIDVSYEFGANGSPQYSVGAVDKWHGVPAVEGGKATGEDIRALIEKMRENAGRLTAHDVETALGAPQRILGTVAEYELDGGFAAVEYISAGYSSVVSLDTVSEIRYVPGGDLPDADELLDKIHVGMTYGELVGELGTPNITYDFSRVAYFTEGFGAVSLYLEFGGYDENGEWDINGGDELTVTDVWEMTGSGQLADAGAAHYIKAGVTDRELLALLGIPYGTDADPYDPNASAEVNYRTEDGMLKLLLDGDGAVIGTYFFEKGQIDVGLLAEYPTDPKNTLSAAAYVNAGDSFADIVKRYGLPTRFFGFAGADEAVFSYATSRGDSTTFNVKFRVEIYIGGDGMTHRTLVAVEGYYL